MPEEVTEDQIEEHFGAIGIIKTDKKTRKKKIWIYKVRLEHLERSGLLHDFDVFKVSAENRYLAAW